MNVIEEGEYEIPELRRLGEGTVKVRDFLGEEAQVTGGRLRCGQFPFVVMTSNAEREFPPPFLRRCIRLTIEPPTSVQLTEIERSHLSQYMAQINMAEVQTLISDFDLRRKENQDVSTDQLLNAVFLTVALQDSIQRTFSKDELRRLRENLLRQLSGPAA